MNLALGHRLDARLQVRAPDQRLDLAYKLKDCYRRFIADIDSSLSMRPITVMRAFRVGEGRRWRPLAAT